MNRLDVFANVCNLIDESPNNATLKSKIMTFIDRGYTELLKKEGKILPTTPLTDTTELICNPKNIDYLVFYAAWNYFLSESDYESAGYYKTEIRYYKIFAPKTPIKIVDVYGGGDIV